MGTQEQIATQILMSALAIDKSVKMAALVITLKAHSNVAVKTVTPVSMRDILARLDHASPLVTAC